MIIFFIHNRRCNLINKYYSTDYQCVDVHHKTSGEGGEGGSKDVLNK